MFLMTNLIFFTKKWNIRLKKAILFFKGHLLLKNAPDGHGKAIRAFFGAYKRMCDVYVFSCVKTLILWSPVGSRTAPVYFCTLRHTRRGPESYVHQKSTICVALNIKMINQLSFFWSFYVCEQLFPLVNIFLWSRDDKLNPQTLSKTFVGGDRFVKTFLYWARQLIVE